VLLTSGYTAQRVIPEKPAGELALLKKPFGHADLSIAIRNIMSASLESRQATKYLSSDPAGVSLERDTVSSVASLGKTWKAP